MKIEELKLYVTGQGKLELKLVIPAEVFVKKKNHDFQLPFFLEM